MNHFWDDTVRIQDDDNFKFESNHCKKDLDFQRPSDAFLMNQFWDADTINQFDDDLSSNRICLWKKDIDFQRPRDAFLINHFWDDTVCQLQ